VTCGRERVLLIPATCCRTFRNLLIGIPDLYYLPEDSLQPKEGMKLIDSSLHPSRDALVGFLNGELPRAQVAVLVRHMLTGCPECTLIACLARRLGRRKRHKTIAKMPRRVRGQAVSIRWYLERRSALLHQLREARTQILHIAEDLSAIRYRLLGVQASLPAGTAETDRLLETDSMDEVTELRTTIACVLRDYLQPAEEAFAGTFAQMLERLRAESGQSEEGEASEGAASQGLLSNE